MNRTSSHRLFDQTHARFRPSITNPLSARIVSDLIKTSHLCHSRLFIDRDRPRVARKHGQRHPLQPDPSERIVDGERRHFAPIATIPKLGRQTNAVRPVAVLALGNVEHDLAHELARVSTSDDGAEHGALHLCVEAFSELTGTVGCELARRHEGLDARIVPEVHQIVEIGLGVWAEQETGGGEHGRMLSGTSIVPASRSYGSCGRGRDTSRRAV